MSFSTSSLTHLGHGTDYVSNCGILGLAPDDTRVREALTLAEEAHLNYSVIEKGATTILHPNTVEIQFYLAQITSTFPLRAMSVGGAVFAFLALTACAFACPAICPIILPHRDKPGVLKALNTILATQNINVANYAHSSAQSVAVAHTVFWREIDEPIEQKVLISSSRHHTFLLRAQVSIPGFAPQVTNDVLFRKFDNGADHLRQVL